MKISKKPILDVYYAEIPSALCDEEIYPEERAREIERVTNERTKREKLFVWQLLRRGVKLSLSAKLEEYKFRKTENGKWECDGFFFSLSHSKDMAAVAISDLPVGVDIELFNPERILRLKDKILTESEAREYESLHEDERAAYLTEKWTQKESSFKRSGGRAFMPARLTPDGVQSTRLELRGESYCLSVSSPHSEKARIIKLD